MNWNGQEFLVDIENHIIHHFLYKTSGCKLNETMVFESSLSEARELAGGYKASLCSYCFPKLGRI